MGLVDYVVIVSIGVIMAIIMVRSIKRVKKGEVGCSCGCSGCASAKMCHGEERENKK